MSTLKDALYQSIHHSKKPLKSIAEELNISVSYLTRAALPDQDECETGTGCRFPLERLIPLIRCTGDYGVLDYIEEQIGRVAYVLPKKHQAKFGLFELSLDAVKEFGELMAEVRKDMADNKLTAKEKEKIRKEGYEAIQAISAFMEIIN